MWCPFVNNIPKRIIRSYKNRKVNIWRTSRSCQRNAHDSSRVELGLYVFTLLSLFTVYSRFASFNLYQLKTLNMTDTEVLLLYIILSELRVIYPVLLCLPVGAPISGYWTVSLYTCTAPWVRNLCMQSQTQRWHGSIHYTTEINPLWAHKNRGANDHYTAVRWLVGIHWPLMGGLLYLVQRGWDWAGCGPTESPFCCTKCNSPPINGQCTNFILFDVALTRVKA